ncbi:MAG TPA: hypothetical protein VF173_14765 [Thermoanaerobaculia bacterium]|nr:hypothetical protein [Thermoanaerobaculia bacterium]
MKTRSPLSKLWKLALAAGLLLFAAPALRTAEASPCPPICGYTYDPVSHCCVTGPKFDCFDFCISDN